MIDRRQQRPLAVAVHRLGEFEVPLCGGVQIEVVAGVVRLQAHHGVENAHARPLDVREDGAGGGDARPVVQADAVEGGVAELLAQGTLGPTGGEGRLVVVGHRRVGAFTNSRQQVRPVVDGRSRQHLDGVETVKLGEDVRRRLGRRHEELAGRHVREREAVAAVDGDDAREELRRRVGRLQ